MNSFYRLSALDLLMFLRHFRILLASGQPVANCMDVLSRAFSHLPLGKSLASAGDKLKNGQPLASALFGKSHPFPPLMERCLAAMPPEAAGMEKVIEQLENNFRLQTAFAGESGKGLTEENFHWVALAGFSCLLVFGLPSFVKDFLGIYYSASSNLPGPTVLLVHLSNFFENFWFLAWPGFTILFHFILFAGPRRQRGSSRTAFVFSMISEQLSSGADLKQALSWTADSVDHSPTQKALRSALADLENGRGPEEAFRSASFFPDVACDLIAYGEKSGDLKKPAQEIAAHYRQISEGKSQIYSIRGATLLVILLIFLAVFIAVALYLPIFKLGSII